MKSTDAEIKNALREYIVTQFLPGENLDAIKDDTELLTSGVLDSIGTVKLVSFLEEKYGIELEAYEISVDYLNTLDDILKVIRSKQTSN